MRNSGWEVPEQEEKEPVEKLDVEPERSLLSKFLIPAGIAGMILWIVFTPFKADAPGMEISKQKAREIAVKELTDRFGVDGEEWKVLSNISPGSGLAQKFIWKEYNKEGYDKTIGKFLAPPRWNVRLVKTSGDVEDRTEEYSIGIDINAEVFNYSHKIPEKREGAIMEQEDAQLLADSAMLSLFGINSKNLKEISITPEKLANRRDWTFIFADTVNYTPDKGQGRYSLSIAGDKAVSAAAYVHVPEDWERKYNDDQSKRRILRTIGSIIPILILIAGMVWGIFRWTRKEFLTPMFIYFCAGIFIIFLLNTFLTWDSILYSYDTSVPMSNFITMLLVSAGIGAIFSAAGFGIIGGMSTRLVTSSHADSLDWIRALSLGLFFVGIQSLLMKLEIKTSPLSGDYSGAVSMIPGLSSGLNNIQTYISTAGFLLVLYAALDTFTHQWTRSKLLYGGLAVLTGILLQASNLESYSIWIVSGLISGLILLLAYIFILRYHFNWIPVIAAVFVICGIVKAIILGAIPSALSGGMLSIVLVAVLSWWWFTKFPTTQTR